MTHNQSHHVDRILSSVQMDSQETQVDPLIQQSWRRCVTDFNMEPSPTRSARVLTQQELKDHRAPVEEFIHIAKSGLHELYRQVSPLNYVVLLTDCNGITVDYIGNEKYDEELKHYSLYLGSDWNEERAGTCGVGICATEMQPVTVHLDDHFDLKHTSLTCSAAPIFDPEGKPLGVLDVSSLSAPKVKESQFLLLQLVKLHAQIIESANFVHHFQQDHWIIRFGHLQDYVNINAPQMLAIDESGRIKGLNTAARHYLCGASSFRSEAWQEAIGKKITDYFDCPMEEVIQRDSVIERGTRTTRLSASGDTVFFSVSAPFRDRLVLPRALADNVGRKAPQNDKKYLSLDELAGADPTIQKSIKLAKRLVNHKINFLIQGETGSGKEIFARAIHMESDRRDKPFIAVNCAAIPESLIESELFGYKPGTFTGARSKGMKGLIQQSSGGTLFLDEIGDMPVHLQTRLLRVLSEHEIMPLGSDRAVPVDLNVIAATHRRIESMISEGEFREDLYFRLAAVTLVLPAMRERQDLEYLIRNALIIEADNADMDITAEALELLMSYHWPGNVRELRNTLRVASTFSDQRQVNAEDLPDDFIRKLQHAPLIRPVKTACTATPMLDPELPQDPKIQRLLSTLKKNCWNITDTADELGTSRATIYRKMKKYNIVPPNNLGY